MKNNESAAPAKLSKVQTRNKLYLTNLQTRTLTFFTLAPAIVYFGLLSRWNVAVMVWICMFFAGLEWTGIKRHLKVELLLLRNSSSTASSNDANVLSNVAAIKATSTNNTIIDTANIKTRNDLPQKSSEALTQKSTHSLSPANAVALETSNNRPEEYRLPVPKITLYVICKHFGWACLAYAAYRSLTCFFVTLSMYFLIFVTVTLTAHNRLEMKVQEAADMLSGPLFISNTKKHHISNNINSSNNTYNEDEQNKVIDKERENVVVSPLEQQRINFHAMELLMIAEKQPTEQFLDFCLDIFGIMWISGIVYPLFCYSIPKLGIQWLLSATISNFLNDAAALIVGKSIRNLRDRFCHMYDCSSASGVGASLQSSRQENKKLNNNKSSQENNAKPHYSSAPLYTRWILSMPHPLYPAISPNKSLEGAVAGVIGCMLSFTLCMYIYQVVVIHSLPNNAFISPRYSCMTVWITVGVIMGVFGVIGDLLQSLLKRSAHVKDAGFIIPGHGGVLDRIDGLLLVYPLLYCIMCMLGALSGSDITNASQPSPSWSYTLSHLFC